MKIKMEVYLKGLKKEINRVINVNDNMTLQNFCEYTIVSMNGNCKHLYQLIINGEYTFLGFGCNIIDEEREEMMEDLKISDLELQKGDELLLNYDFRADWDFIIKIKEVKEGYFEKDFEVISGVGQGIFEELWNSKLLKECIRPDLNETNKKFYSRIYKGFDKYIDKKFDISNINKEIDDYEKKYRELVKPKRYIMNIALEGYKTEIKRKISVDSNVKLDKFCRCVILSMNGDLSHLYGIKIGKGVSIIAVSANMNIQNVESKAGIRRLQIVKNNEIISNVTTYVENVATYTSLVQSKILLEVQENDIIYLAHSSATVGDVVARGYTGTIGATFMTVETVC